MAKNPAPRVLVEKIKRKVTFTNPVVVLNEFKPMEVIGYAKLFHTDKGIEAEIYNMSIIYITGKVPALGIEYDNETETIENGRVYCLGLSSTVNIDEAIKPLKSTDYVTKN